MLKKVMISLNRQDKQIARIYRRKTRPHKPGRKERMNKQTYKPVISLNRPGAAGE